MASASVSSKVQHVAKASSDELLRKFADSEAGKASRGRSSGCGRRGGCRATRRGTAASTAPKSAWRGRQSGRVSSAKTRLPTDLPFFFTWRKMVEGASRMAVERHCSRHVRLISDMV
ncbi:unnamed protein product [Spirodela intermedia]|uniref:Uncharacterized protein n=1 Tax=Spirodela intermedia TaxID=51605 RepID=A0A7I8IAS4_SPIIN|nr:unnamed protein product [Spirodela intermedia]CAA6654857.1 unnamed protein product [Spirodela intermedia]